MKCVCLTLLAALSLLHTCSPRGSLAISSCNPLNLMLAPKGVSALCAILRRHPHKLQIRMGDDKDDAEQPCSARNLENASLQEKELCALIGNEGGRRQDHVFLHFGRRR